ncbi:protein of unknown function DUF2461 [Citrifermentans bemidjiense Bem]|uniref:TIGR02453 family protein n=1 Tax=Citrifermentans bemidjiense (strain ATCC BAA-1014 / DSM 16622 / JCM 12645 / Bem) TaxID=404380 RepID=B5ECW9_CITBB|nr:DUF2461 domain-containing protein [Citrifermentans bemidjiense]ACH40586.1 protein of unknown function DUF2461 [Citrifermentans bemidjiense Bem]
MIEKFEGFPAGTFQFLRNLNDNNNKQWFELHKSDYQDNVLKPLQSLAAGLGPFMQSLDPDLEVRPALNKTISRIYRDTRFSRDKSPYKTSHWITFKRPRIEWKDYPAYFFEISPDSYRYGMGFYSASRETMDRFRKSIDSKPAKFHSATSFFSSQNVFTIEGDRYKRPLKPGIPAELNDWYNRKSIYLASNQPVTDSFIDKTLISDLVSGFGTIAPLYHYLCKVAAY